VARVFIIILLLAAGALAQGPTTPDSLLGAAQRHYDNGDFDLAELAALRGLRSAAGLDEFERIKYHALLGFVYVAKEQRDAAIQEFVAVLEVNPRYEPDPVTTSPKILEVFRQAKADYMLRVSTEPAVHRMPQADARLAASWRSLAAPGWGQIYKDQKVKGAVVIAAQVLSLAVLVYMQSEVHRRHDDYLALKIYGDPNIDDRYQEYRRAYQTRNAVGYITLGIYVANYLDALYVPVRKK
jgi:hypothetical protein